MDSNFQTSFIPKKPVVQERVISSRPIGLFAVISIFVLLTVILASAGLYFYKKVLVKNIADMQQTLIADQKRFEKTKIEELQKLDKRLRASSEILSKHITVAPIFQALQMLTLKSIRYTNFSYSIGTDKDQKIAIKMSGIATGYQDIALQSDLFSSKDIGKHLIDPVFSNLTLDDKGNVVFDLEFSVDSNFVNYKQVFSAQS